MFACLRRMVHCLAIYATCSLSLCAELPLVVVICSYNNAPWVEKNLDSVFVQEYENFHVIYVDDASEDGTADCVRDYITKHGLQDKLTLICNAQRCRKLKNMYTTFHTIPDDNIIVHIDGDDWLAHAYVLMEINDAYQEYGCWITYSQLRNWPGGKRGIARDLPKGMVTQRDFRKTWVYYPPRTYYPWLFKLIKLQDLLADEVPGYAGQFYPVSDDLATFFPMLEMAHYHYKFINDISYIRNRDNPISDAKVNKPKVLQSNNELFNKPKYPVVPEPIINRLAAYEHAQAQVVLFTRDPLQAKNMLHTLYEQINGVNVHCLVYELSENTHKGQFELLAHLYGCTCLSIDQLPTLNELLCNDHVFLMHDCDSIGDLDINRCIQELERTFAFGFYFGVDPQCIQYHQPLYDNISAWKFKCLKQPPCPNITIHASLYRRQDVIDALSVEVDSIESLEHVLQNCVVDQNQVGLFFTT